MLGNLNSYDLITWTLFSKEMKKETILNLRLSGKKNFKFYFQFKVIFLLFWPLTVSVHNTIFMYVEKLNEKILFYFYDFSSSMCNIYIYIQYTHIYLLIPPHITIVIINHLLCTYIYLWEQKKKLTDDATMTVNFMVG